MLTLGEWAHCVLGDTCELIFACFQSVWVAISEMFSSREVLCRSQVTSSRSILKEDNGSTLSFFRCLSTTWGFRLCFHFRPLGQPQCVGWSIVSSICQQAILVLYLPCCWQLPVQFGHIVCFLLYLSWEGVFGDLFSYQLSVSKKGTQWRIFWSPFVRQQNPPVITHSLAWICKSPMNHWTLHRQ